MTSESSTTGSVWVAIDVAKACHQVLIELPGGQRRAWRVANATAEVGRLVSYLRSLKRPCLIAFEPTGDYHRPVMHLLGRAGFQLRQVSSLAVARTREALYNSWDKNDPKDAQVILHLLKTGATQRFLDPLITGHNDLQELANTYQQVSLRKVRLQHAIVTHHLPMYFPEAERYLHSSRAEWFTELLLLTPCPAAVRHYSKAAFIGAVRERIGGRKVDKARWLADFYDTAGTSLGLPVGEDTEAMRMFRLVLEEYLQLCRRRKQLERDIVERLAGQPDFDRLQTVPGIGPILALIILAESRDLRRFGHVRQFLKFCGFDLCTEQSGQFRGTTHLSKRGNARLRYAFWMAGAVAVRMQQNSFRRKFEDYVRPDPQNGDRRRKAYTAVAAKMARVVYAVITSGSDYRRFPEATRPGGRIPSPRAVEASQTTS
jgi:transposase